VNPCPLVAGRWQGALGPAQPDGAPGLPDDPPAWLDAFPNWQVEYTVATNEDPDPRAAFINCQSSFVLQDAYARDRVLQDELQELEELRVEYEKYQQLLAFWDHVLKMKKFGTPPEPLPPPPPPPYPALPGTDLLVGPPAPPKLVTPEEQTQQFLERQSEIALRIADLIDIVGTCVPSATTTCGLPANEVRRVPVGSRATAGQRHSHIHDCNTPHRPPRRRLQELRRGGGPLFIRSSPPDHCANHSPKSTLEVGRKVDFGSRLWKSTLEVDFGRLWKSTLEVDFGSRLWKSN